MRSGSVDILCHLDGCIEAEAVVGSVQQQDLAQLHQQTSSPGLGLTQRSGGYNEIKGR